MNIIDIVVILVVLAFGFLGSNRGVIKQVVTTVGFILAVVIAFFLKNPLAEFLSILLPFFDFGGQFAGATSLNIIMYNIIAFLLIVLILESIVSIFVKISGIIEKILRWTVILGIPSKILGFFVGIIEGFVITFLLLFFFSQPALNISLVNESKLTPVILNSTPVLSDIGSDLVETVDDIYELVGDYSDKKMDSNSLNLKAIDIMLDHKLITPKYVRKLIDHKKIDVVGIDSVINKYD